MDRNKYEILLEYKKEMDYLTIGKLEVETH